VSTAAGAVKVRQPRINDKRVDETTGERKRFASSILPAWARKSPHDKAIPRRCRSASAWSTRLIGQRWLVWWAMVGHSALGTSCPFAPTRSRNPTTPS
jgi:hypothetical protein